MLQILNNLYHAFLCKIDQHEPAEDEHALDYSATCKHCNKPLYLSMSGNWRSVI